MSGEIKTIDTHFGSDRMGKNLKPSSPNPSLGRGSVRGVTGFSLRLHPLWHSSPTKRERDQTVDQYSSMDVTGKVLEINFLAVS
jgi:hypothetical protein